MQNEELIARLEAAEWYCEAPCFGPIMPYRWHQRLINWLCWVVIVRVIPAEWMMKRPFRWMLPYCGNHAYACSCPEKNKARLAALRAQVDRHE